MFRELRGWAVDLWRNHRVLSLVLGALLLRLLVHVDGYFTIRDMDFFSPDLTRLVDRGFRGGRVIPVLLSAVWGLLSGGDPLLAKQVFAKLLLIPTLPAFVLLARRAGLDNRAAGFALALFLVNAQLFALYDTLGPYFLLIALTLWQVLFALDTVDQREGAFKRYVLVSVLALLCHRNALATTAVTGGLLLLGRPRLDRKGLAMVAGLGGLAAWKVVQALHFDAAERAYQATVYGEGLMRSTGWESAPSGPAALTGVLTLFPGWAGVMVWSSFPYLLLATVVVIAATAAGGIGLRRELRWLFGLGVGAAASQAIISEVLSADLFFQPNHATYAFVWMPFVALLLAVALTRRLPARAGAAALVILLAVNLWQGYQFRGQAFDHEGYQELLTSEPRAEEVPRRLVPAFLAKEYGLRFAIPSEKFRPDDEARYNDFTTLADKEFILDIINYDELGFPLYRYGTFRRHLEAWATQRGLELRCLERATFTSCRASAP